MEYKELEKLVVELQARVSTLENEKEVYQNKHILRKDLTVLGNVYATKLYRKNSNTYQEVTS